MNRRLEIFLVTGLLLLAALYRSWDLSRLPPGFSDDELAYIRLTEAVQSGNIAVYYQVGDGVGRAGMYAVLNAGVTAASGDGLLGYRLLPFWAGLLSLALLYGLARRLFGTYVALIALATMAVNVRAVLLARSATTESIVPLFVLLTLFALVRAFHVGREVRFRAPETAPFALLALLFGTSGYLHYTALVLGPIGALFFAHLLITRQPVSRRVWSVAFFVVMLATVVALPYLTSTVRELTASEVDILVVERPRSLNELANGLLSAVGGIIWRGDENPAANLPGLALLGPITSVLLLLGIVRAVQRWREPRYALVLLVLLAGVATDVWVTPEASFTAHLAALPALYILPGIGVMVVWRALRVRDRAQAGRLVTTMVVVFVAVNIALTWNRVFDRWGGDAVEAEYHANLGRIAAYLDRTPDDAPVSICLVPLGEPGDIGLTMRQILPLMMHREDVEIRHSDCRGGLVFINAGAPMRLVFANPDDRALMPPELAEWLEGAEELEVEGMPDGSAWRLNVEQQIRDLGGYWNTEAPTFFLPEREGSGSRQATLPVTLERNLTFAGYDPRGLSARRAGGDPIVLATYWRVDGPLPPNLGIFAHLLAYINLRLQPLAEANTISIVPAELENRDIFVQVSYLWLSDRLRPGEYPLTLGAYAGEVAAVESHLRVIDREVSGRLRGDRLLLGEVEVLPVKEPDEDS